MQEILHFLGGCKETSRCMIIELGNLHARVWYLYERGWKGLERGTNEKESVREWKLDRGTSTLLIIVSGMQ